MAGFPTFVLFLLGFAVVLVVLGVKSVPQGREFTVERFGRYTQTLRPGLNLIIPIIDRIGSRMNMKQNQPLRRNARIAFRVQLRWWLWTY